MIAAEHLCFSYTGAPPFVLSDIDLRIRKGEYVSVVGDNGSGKSTFIRLILKFLKPTSGSVRTGARRIGYVPQKSDFSDAGFPITVREALNSYRKLLRLKDKTAVAGALAQVGMTDCSGALMGSLSGGQSQKIRIARALMGEPELLILDEPSVGVDIGSQKEIYAFLRNKNRERGVTIVSVEHNLEAAIACSTLIYHLKGGRGHLCSPGQYAGEMLKGREPNGNPSL
jgi:zinc transport system ATP-binding protein